MQPPPEQVALFFLGVLGALAVSGILVAWLIEQHRQGREVLPYRARRPVPWRGRHVLVLALVFILAPSVVRWGLELAELDVVLLETIKKTSASEENNRNGAPDGDSSSSPDQRSSPSVGKVALRFEAENRTSFERLGPGQTPTESPAGVQPKQEQGHEIEQLLRQGGGIGVWVLAALMALIAAPLIEEWLFRAVLQGWLEKMERRLFRQVRWYERMRAAAAGDPLRPKTGLREFWWNGKLLGAAPVAVSSLLFAGLHVRLAGPPTPADEILLMLLCQGLGNLLSFAAGMVFLRIACGARAEDFGLSKLAPQKEIPSGLLAYLVVVGPVYAVMILTKILLLLFGAEQIAPDPAPLLVLSLVLGLMYFRTHQLLPCMVLHMAFNATGLAIFWAFS